MIHLLYGSPLMEIFGYVSDVGERCIMRASSFKPMLWSKNAESETEE
jgi:hypothetical protein